MEKSDYFDTSKVFEGDSLLSKNSGSSGNTNSNINGAENLLASRRVMTKVKPNRICVSLQQRIRSSIRYIVIVVLIFVISYFGVHYMQIDHQSLPMLAKDRSESYNVKILPNDLSDRELNELSKESFSYLAMIDAGSSGCRAHVYRYGKLGSISGPLYILPQHQSKKVKPGLSSFAEKPNEAGMSLADLVHFLKDQVPEKDWDVTPIWLKATAGLRMLPSEKSEAILDSVRAFLSDKRNSPFLFRASWAKVIPGNEEGGFGWIAFNYLKKIIGPKRDKTVKVNPFAVIEMGGASAQVSQMAPTAEEAAKIPKEYRFSFTIEDDEYHLYTHSYLGFGAEQAREQFNRYLARKHQQDLQQKQQQVAEEALQLHPANISDPCKHDGATPSVRHYHFRQLNEPSATISTTTTSNTNIQTPISTQTHPESAYGDHNTHSHSSSGGSNSFLGQCATHVASLFNHHAHPTMAPPTTDTNAEPACSLSLPQTFNCVHQPSFVAESNNILAFENFFYMSSALAVPPLSISHHHKHNNDKSNNNNSLIVQATTFPLETTPSMIRKTSDHFCSLSWPHVEEHYPKDAQPKDVNGKMCFLSGFAYAFLVDGLKIPSEKTITIQKEVDGSEIEWALGAAYKEAAGFLKRTNLRPT